MSEKLGCLEWWWLGGIYSSNHQFNRWGVCLSMGALDSPVRQPRHPTVRVLTVSTVGALTSWGTGQYGTATRQVLFTVRCAFWHCSDSARTVRALFTLQVTVGVDRYARQPLLRWHTRQSGGTPDSPVNYSGAVLQKPEGGKFEVVRLWVLDSQVRLTRVLFGFFCFFLLNPNFDLFISLC
jgi:hypothetical protein